MPVVREEGLEPSRPCDHWHLKPACLPFHHKRVRRERLELSPLQKDTDLNRACLPHSTSSASG
jgi:hypothetical protein